jgi:rubrerythrin
MTDETRDETKKGEHICPSCGKELGADPKGGTSAQGVCPRCGSVKGEGGTGGSCSCSSNGGGG